MDHTYEIDIPNDMPAPRGFKANEHPKPPPRGHFSPSGVQNIQETSMSAYINESFQSDAVEGMSSEGNECYYDEVCAVNVSQLTKKETAAAELIHHACHSADESTLSYSQPTGPSRVTTHDCEYDQYNATYMEPRDCQAVQVNADIEVIEDSTLTPTNLPPPPPFFIN